MRFLFVSLGFSLFLGLPLSLGACGDDDYGQDLGGKADLSGSVIDAGKD